MPRILDTTLLIDYANGRFGAGALLERLFEEADDLLVCDAVVAEAFSKGTDDERRAIASLIAAVEYVSTTPEAAAWAGEARRLRGASGPRTLGDALIAGVAWSLGATVVTRNPDDFMRMGVPVLAYDVDAPA
jgi:predicted nucleic acid-binding protein